MNKLMKYLSLLVILLLVPSNIAFAKYSGSPEPNLHEGRSIEDSNEGEEYHKEGNIVIYPVQTNSNEKEMMNRVMRGELSEEEMQRIAMAKMGDKFSEEDFKRGMMELKERMGRRETFSYEHGGYGTTYYAGPSYEGYSKEHMIFGMIFEYIGDEIDPREIKKNCVEPEKIADGVLIKLKEKTGDLQNICTKFEEQESKCADHSKKSCSNIGTAFVREDANEIEKINAVAYSCPVKEDAIIEACKRRSKFHMEQRLQNMDEQCKKRFDFEGDRLTRECEKFKEYQVCDKVKYVKQCMGNFGVKREDFEKPITCSKEECGPAPAMPNYLCPDGNTWAGHGGCVRKRDGSCSWEIISCPSTIDCPEVRMPTCGAGVTAQKHTGKSGCVFYICASVPDCPQIAIKMCPEGATLEKKTDERGCPDYTSYQCIKNEIQCPEVSRVTCAEGQSLITRYDDKRCVVGYECISVTTKSTTQSTETTATTSGTTTETSATTGQGATTSASTTITGQVVLNTYDDFLRHCENNWREQERICQNTPSVCDKSAFIENCKEHERKGYSDFISRIEKNCEIQTISEVKSAERRCSRTDEDRKRCLEDSAKRCEHMKGIAQQCRDLMTEEKIRNFIIEETKKRCKFTEILQDTNDVRNAEKAEIVLAVLNTATKDDFEKLILFVDNLHEDLKLQDTTVYKGTIEPNRFRDIKLLPFVVNAKISAVRSTERAKEVKARIVAGQKAEEAASKLVSLRDSDVPSEYLYIIEDKASEVLDVSDDLEEIEKKDEQKGMGYKIKLFLGLAKRAEQEEIKQLEGSKEKLRGSIEALAKLIDEVPNDVARAILKEQVESLKNQQGEIEVLIETKEKKSKGFFGMFG
ncbi:MAG: hypothetical protein AABX33_05055 [Nanoarchaeota archaeon]